MVKAYAVIGAGYGDEGKGLMVSYFGEKERKAAQKSHRQLKVLGIRSNGGHQSGHTACVLLNGTYKHFVFHSLSSATFSGADTFLGSRFIVYPSGVLSELDAFNSMYGYRPEVIASPRCRLQLTIDRMLNRELESVRSNKHGTCGMGVFETVNRGHMSEEYSLRILDCMALSLNELTEKIVDVSMGYIKTRISEVRAEDGNEIADNLESTFSNISDNEIRQHCIKDAKVIYDLLATVKVKRLSEIVDDTTDNEMKYNRLIFEAGQGLELDWSDTRNRPHVTASHTGLKNVVKESSENGLLDAIENTEVCYVTRSYKTKHGDGNFVEQCSDIVSRYHLYDRTNVPNAFQGTLQFGAIDHKRMVELIKSDIRAAEAMGLRHIHRSLAITHIDQTDEAVIELADKETDQESQYMEIVYFLDETISKDIHAKTAYYSFGEKPSDVQKSKLNIK